MSPSSRPPGVVSEAASEPQARPGTSPARGAGSRPGRAPEQLALPGFEAARDAWREECAGQVGGDVVRNRSGIEVLPLYTPAELGGSAAESAAYQARLGFPGQPPFTRGIYASMHRGRPWTQRQLIGVGMPEDYNARLKELLAAGATAVSLIPCNSFMRGYDIDEVDRELVGTCGTPVNTVEDLDLCLRDIDLASISTALNDPLPFTMLAMLLALARRRGVAWTRITGTSNQSDYLSHCAANHMFYRLSLPGSRRVLVDHVAYANRHVPGWNPVSVVGQHMQQAGATPAQAMGFALCTALQFARDCADRGMEPDAFLPRFTFFFDLSISFFEEIAKLRAGRRIWARLVRERLGARDPRSWRFKFHAQTSGVDLTRQQPLNNVARVAVQAMAGIFGGLQSLHTDAYDEALSTPTERAARVAVATQRILRDEAHLGDVIDPLGGSYYVESLTDAMEARILKVIDEVDAAGGMFEAIASGLVQRVIGESALRFQQRIDDGEQAVVGVNTAVVDDEALDVPPLERPSAAAVDAQLARLAAFKANRSGEAVARALDGLARAAGDDSHNVFEATVQAAEAGATHGEMTGTLRRELGFGQPILVG